MSPSVNQNEQSGAPFKLKESNSSVDLIRETVDIAKTTLNSIDNNNDDDGASRSENDNSINILDDQKKDKCLVDDPVSCGYKEEDKSNQTGKDNSTREHLTVFDGSNGEDIHSFEDNPTSLHLADPPSGFKDSITIQSPSKDSPDQKEDASSRLQNSSYEDLSCGSESFDQAVNVIADAQDSADEDIEPPSYNSLPPDLSKVKPITLSLLGNHTTTNPDITMPEQKSYKQVGSPGPMKFSIAGYTERSSTETTYTEKLRIGRSDSNVSSYNSSLRYWCGICYEYLNCWKHFIIYSPEYSLIV